VITLQFLCHYGFTGLQRGMSSAIASIWCGMDAVVLSLVRDLKVNWSDAKDIAMLTL
jgi:hypothetical protein